jgi:ribosomal protein S3AE
MAKKKADTETQDDYKRRVTELVVTLGMIRASVQRMQECVDSKDKEGFRDCLEKLKVYSR